MSPKVGKFSKQVWGISDKRQQAPPFLAENVDARHLRKLTMLKVLDWLELHPGATWQERWNSSGAGADGTADWRDQAVAELKAAGKLGPRGSQVHNVLGTGMVQLIGGDVLRPALPWLLATTSPTRVAEEMGRTRDPAGIAALRGLLDAGTVGRATFSSAVERVALIMAAKGGLVADITPGDCIELLDCCRRFFNDGTRGNRHSPFFYELLHKAGVFPPGAPATTRMISPQFGGQLTVEQLVDRYDLACRPVRDLLVDYLRERQPGIDYTSLVKLAVSLVPCFWKDLENHHPGIDSLLLPPDIAAGWKQRLQTRTVRTPGGGEQAVARAVAPRRPDGRPGVLPRPRPVGPGRPARWGPWAVPCPIRASDIQYKKQKPRPRPAWTPGPANGSRSCPPSPPPSTSTARPPRPGWTPPAPPRPASCSPPAGRPCAGPPDHGHPPRPGPRTPPAASAAT